MLGRRDFLGVAAIAPFALQAKSGSVKSCIFLVLTGGPSHLDTWDLKPDAPSEIRGPFRAIRTNVPGVEISEIFPRMAKQADKYALIRSVYSEGTPHLHEDGLCPIDEATEGFVTTARPDRVHGWSDGDFLNKRRGSRSFAENRDRARQLVETRREIQGAGQYVRYGVSSHYVGQPRKSPVQHDPRLQECGGACVLIRLTARCSKT